MELPHPGRSGRPPPSSSAPAPHHVVEAAQTRLGQLAVHDPVAHDVVVAVVEGLERYGWMLRTQAA